MTKTQLLLALCSITAAASSSNAVLKGVIPRGGRDTDILKRMLQKAEKSNNKGTGDNTNATTTANTAYYHGITLDATKYIYSTPVSVSFELNNQLNISTEILMGLNVSRVNDWELGVFMRMADPQGGSLEPIFAVKPTIVGTGVSSRRLQATAGVRDEMMVPLVMTVKAESDSLLSVSTASDESEELLPTLDYTGSAKIVTTDATTLDPNLYGTGFDVYILDERGAAILGPATFYMLPTPSMKEKEQEEIDHRPNHGLVNHDAAQQQQLQQQQSKAEKDDEEEEEKEEEKAMGYGSGTNGGMVLGTDEALANYVLTTNQAYYDQTDAVTVTYNIGLDGNARRRRMQNIFGNSGKGTTATTTQATSAAAATTATTTKGTIAATTTATTAAAATTTKTMKGGTTTTSATTSGFVATPPIQPVINGDNVKLYVMGVYMRMANPQGGSLRPIHSIPFCPTPCTKTSAQLEKGSFTFDVGKTLNIAQYGTGYDIWILDGNGVGIAGPRTFYVNVPPEETVDGEL